MEAAEDIAIPEKNRLFELTGVAARFRNCHCSAGFVFFGGTSARAEGCGSWDWFNGHYSRLSSYMRTPVTRSPAPRVQESLERSNQLGVAVWTAAIPDGKCVRLLFRHSHAKRLEDCAA